MVTCTARDAAGNVSVPAVVEFRLDRTPPTLTGLPTGCNLWPPNHQFVNVATVVPGDALSGVAPGSFRIDGTSNEPEDAKGNGHTAPDIDIAGGGVQLRAERSGGGTGDTARAQLKFMRFNSAVNLGCERSVVKRNEPLIP